MKRNKMFYIILVILLVISLLGLNNFDNHYLIKQCIWSGIGFILFLFIKKFNLNILLKYSMLIYLLNVLFLILVLIIGNKINGAKAWLSFGGISLQPSELMKISLALVYYKLIMSNNKSSIQIIKIFALFLIPSILVFLEPDTGAIIMYLIIMLVTLFNSKVKKTYLYFLLGLGFTSIIVFFILFFYKQNVIINILGTSIFYRIDRIIHFKNNYQLNQALVYIGSAGLFGHKDILYIPEAHTDFIFSFLIGRYGIIIGLIILTCYFTMDIILVNNSKNNFMIEIFMYLFIYSQIQNILMNLGLFPIMGIPLPFLSYGGTNIIVLFVLLGICQNKKLRQFIA